MNNPFEIIDARLSNIETLLLDLKHSSITINNQTDTKTLLTIQDAATLLHLSVPTLYGYVSKSIIPVSKQGKRLYFSKEELTDWVKAGRKKTISEIQSDSYLKSSRKK